MRKRICEMRTRFISISITGILLLALVTGCSQEFGPGAMPDTGHNYLAIEGEIVGAGLGTRAQTDKLGSYNGFELGDRIGFYSFHASGCTLTQAQHTAAGDPVEYLHNECLTYSDATGVKKFVSAEIKDVIMNSLGLTFAYYPYSEATAPEGYVKLKNGKYEALAKHDHYIHIFDGKNQILDVLTASKRLTSDVNYLFRHQFSMVLLFLGRGFDAKNNEELTVHLTERVIGAHLTREWAAALIPDRLTFTVDRVPLDYEGNIGHASFTAVKRGEYVLEGTTEARTAYSVILPYGSVIDYIEVKDIYGRPQKVRGAELSQLEAGWIYPATLQMGNGLEPTVYPHEITPWGESEKITVERAPGIYDAGEFEDWIGLYTEHLDDFPEIEDEDVYKALEKYGTYDPENKWTFYIRDTIDCSGMQSKDGTLIPRLVDGVTIDGGRYRIKNIMLDLQGAEPAVGMGLFGEIEGGSLRNLRLYFPTVRYQGKKPSGCIAAVISGGTVVDCTVREALMTCAEKAGVLAGEMTGGRVHECKVHGAIEATPPDGIQPEYRGVLGAVSEEASIGTITNSVKFVESK